MRGFLSLSGEGERKTKQKKTKKDRLTSLDSKSPHLPQNTSASPTSPVSGSNLSSRIRASPPASSSCLTHSTSVALAASHAARARSTSAPRRTRRPPPPAPRAASASKVSTKVDSRRQRLIADRARVMRWSYSDLMLRSSRLSLAAAAVAAAAAAAASLFMFFLFLSAAAVEVLAPAAFAFVFFFAAALRLASARFLFMMNHKGNNNESGQDGAK